MAKITFTADDGSVQEFEVKVSAPTVSEVDVKESDGSEVITTPAETPAVETAETPAA